MLFQHPPDLTDDLLTPERSAELKKTAVYYCNLIAVGLIVGSLGPALADLARQTGTDLGGVSLVLVMRPLGYLMGALACSVWLDKRDGHPILALAAVACAGLLAAVPSARALPVLAALILALGFAHSLLDVGSNTLIAWVYGRRLGPYLSGMHFSFGVGAFVGPMLVGWSLAAQGRSAWAFWAIAVLLLPLALSLHLVPSPAHAAPGPAVEAAPLDRGLAAAFLGLFFLYGGLEAGFGAWIYQYAVSLRLVEATHAAALTSLFWGLLGLGRLLGIPVLAFIRPRQLLMGVIPAALLSLGLVLGLPGSVAALWVGTAGLGLSLSCVFPTLLVLAGLRLAGGGRVSGRTTSLLFVGSSSGGMTLPWLMGQLFEPMGPRAAMAAAWAALALLTALFGWLNLRWARQDAAAALRPLG
jgi:fucose permease